MVALVVGSTVVGLEDWPAAWGWLVGSGGVGWLTGGAGSERLALVAGAVGLYTLLDRMTSVYISVA